MKLNSSIRGIQRAYMGGPGGLSDSQWQQFGSHLNNQLQSHLGFGTSDGFFEIPRELARDQEAHRSAQSFGFHTAKSNFEGVVRSPKECRIQPGESIRRE
jgi:hypothetical protein